MAEATILERCRWVNDPAWEVVKLECSDGETYRCTKFKTVQAAWVGSNRTSAANIALGVKWTTGAQTLTISIKGTGTTDVPVTLIIRGES